MRQETTQVFQFSMYRVQLEQFLTQFQFHLYKGGNDIDDLACFLQVKSCSRDPFRHILHKRYESLEIADYIALDSLGFVVLFLYIWLESDASNKIGFLLRKFANCHSLQTLHYNLNGAIWHTYHAGDT